MELTNSYMYVVKCIDNTLYTGYTTDLVRRIKAQNNLKVLGTKLKDMNIHSNMLIAFIVRNNKQIFPNGNDEIKLGDNVVIVSYKQKIEHIDDILRG